MGFVPLVTKNQALGGQIGKLFQEMLKRLRQEILILFLGQLGIKCDKQRDLKVSPKKTIDLFCHTQNMPISVQNGIFFGEKAVTFIKEEHFLTFSMKQKALSYSTSF